MTLQQKQPVFKYCSFAFERHRRLHEAQHFLARYRDAIVMSQKLMMS